MIGEGPHSILDYTPQSKNHWSPLSRDSLQVVLAALMSSNINKMSFQKIRCTCNKTFYLYILRSMKCIERESRVRKFLTTSVNHPNKICNGRTYLTSQISTAQIGKLV